MTPLQFAARSGNEEFATWLLERDPRGVMLRGRDARGATAIDAAKANGRDRIARILEAELESRAG